jgi:ABC-type nickel/cobalt efflux system permease component RcnA
MARGGDGHAHHHHGQNHHGHHHSIQWDDAKSAERGGDCACGHHIAPAALERSGLAGAAAAVLSVGIRPCTGALVVLVFALAQGIFWAGVASTFIMALGTAITVAALAGLAVGAKDVARRLARGDDRRAAQVLVSVELLAALFITALGAVLFVGSLTT